MAYPVVQLTPVLHLQVMIIGEGTQVVVGLAKPIITGLVTAVLHLILHLLSDLLITIGMGGTATIIIGVPLMTISKGRGGK
jgi:hypothetical protein